jgi:hypothetical protein
MLTPELPNELIWKILNMADLPIDTRLAFGIRPKKLREARAWRLWWLLKSHDGLIYNLESKSLHIFRIPGFHIVRRPVEIDRMDNWLTVINETQEPHDLEVTAPDGAHVVTPGNREPFFTELKVLLRGSGLTRVMNACNCT